MFGQTRQVYQTSGANLPTSSQAGLTLDTTGLVSSNSYSVEFVTKLFDRNGAWRRLIDVQNRQSDNGFYVDPSNNLNVYPIHGSSANFTTSTYHDVVLVDNAGTVSAYLDGVQQFSVATTVMDINNADNPGNLMNFYLDNLGGSGQGEYSNANTALIKLYSGALSSSDVTVLDRNPFAGAPSTVPEGNSVVLLTFAMAPLGLMLSSRPLRRRQ